jgi:hypothetical protein
MTRLQSRPVCSEAMPSKLTMTFWPSASEEQAWTHPNIFSCWRPKICCWNMIFSVLYLIHLLAQSKKLGVVFWFITTTTTTTVAAIHQLLPTTPSPKDVMILSSSFLLYFCNLHGLSRPDLITSGLSYQTASKWSPGSHFCLWKGNQNVFLKNGIWSFHSFVWNPPHFSLH